ncbi:HNH endonuclease [Nitrospina watsonii]|uniref:HNHc domain-containing protein n=1 Tax=Nitrospina watsonii TaxID=1323948 RepID=A0ABM9HC05_9BACT|nr:HNH endonuclease [Nitrospina watsonii]CAI2717684.1 HNHc domain-containing protein [Nitrospina watsonii]
MKRPRTSRSKQTTPGEAPKPEQVEREKQKAKALRQTAWWHSQLDRGVCHYCGETFAKKDLTMDHLLPLARGGKSTKGNVVVACKPCNSEKKYYTPAEMILKNKLGGDVQF